MYRHSCIGMDHVSSCIVYHHDDVSSVLLLRKLHRALAPQLKLTRQPPKVYLFWFFFVALALADYLRTDGHRNDAGHKLIIGPFGWFCEGFRGLELGAQRSSF